MNEAGVSHLLQSRGDRKRLGAAPTTSTRVLHETSGLSDEPRKKLIELSKKLGMERHYANNIIIARDDRKKLEVSIPSISTTTLLETQGLTKEPRYKTVSDLERKMGVSDGYFRHLINAREFRKKSGTAPEISSKDIHQTAGLSDEPRKKLLESVSEGKIKSDDIPDVVRKVKEFPEPEQQVEIQFPKLL